MRGHVLHHPFCRDRSNVSMCSSFNNYSGVEQCSIYPRGLYYQAIEYEQNARYNAYNLPSEPPQGTDWAFF